MFEAIVSQAHFAICLREKFSRKYAVPPPQLWGGQHTEMFVNHVTVFSQSVSHIRLSHTIYHDNAKCLPVFRLTYIRDAVN